METFLRVYYILATSSSSRLFVNQSGSLHNSISYEKSQFLPFDPTICFKIMPVHKKLFFCIGCFGIYMISLAWCFYKQKQYNVISQELSDIRLAFFRNCYSFQYFCHISALRYKTFKKKKKILIKRIKNKTIYYHCPVWY